MEEMKRKFMRVLRWATAILQLGWQEAAQWLREYWFALLIGVVVGILL